MNNLGRDTAFEGKRAKNIFSITSIPMEPIDDNTGYRRITFLDCDASVERARATGQIPRNCRIEHTDLWSTYLNFKSRLGFYPDNNLRFCPRCFVDCGKPENWATQEEYAEYFHDVEENIRKVDTQRASAYHKKHAGHFLGAREFTLTYSPKWFNDEEARQKMELAIKRICKYHKTEIIELRAVGEVGKEGNSHVHCYYLLVGGKKIPEKHFQRAYPPWDSKVKLSRTGHKGGHHAEVKNEADFKSYIDKEVDGSWLEVHIDNREE